MTNATQRPIRAGGKVLRDTATTDESTRAIQALNDFLPTDRRVEVVMLAISDGLTIVRKHAPGEA